MQPHGRAGEARAELAISADTFERWCIGEREKEREAPRAERKTRPCLRSWLPVTYTLTLYIHLSPKLPRTFHAAFGYPDDHTTSDHHPPTSRANKFSRAGDDKNYYRARSSSFALFSKCTRETKKSYRFVGTISAIPVSFRKLSTVIGGEALPWEITRLVINIDRFDYNAIVTVNAWMDHQKNNLTECNLVKSNV